MAVPITPKVLAILIALLWGDLVHGEALLRFTQQPKSQVLLEGSHTTLRCSARSIIQPTTYKWLLDGQLLSIKDGSKYSWQGYHGNLVAKNVRRTDDKTFRCIASNPLGSVISTMAILQAAYFEIPSSFSYIRIVTRNTYESFQISPPIVFSRPPAVITWMKNSREVPDGDKGRIFISPQATLYILATTQGEAGTYTAQARNPVTGQSVKQDVCVYVRTTSVGATSMRFLRKPQNAIVVAGLDKNITLECIVGWAVVQGFRVTNPIVPDITWYKGRNKIDPTTSPSLKYGYLHNSTKVKAKLIIYNPDKTDDGLYSCYVNDGALALNADAIVNVVPGYHRSPAEFVGSLATTMVGFTGHDVIIVCPRVERSDSYKWYKDAQPLTGSRIFLAHKNGSVMIRNVMVSDTGLYQVIIGNNHGEVTAPPVYLHVIDVKPPPPTSPSLEVSYTTASRTTTTGIPATTTKAWSSTTSETTTSTTRASTTTETTTKRTTGELLPWISSSPTLNLTTEQSTNSFPSTASLTTERTIAAETERPSSSSTTFLFIYTKEPKVNTGKEKAEKQGVSENGRDLRAWQGVALTCLVLLWVAGFGMLIFYKRNDLKRTFCSPRERFSTYTSTASLTGAEHTTSPSSKPPNGFRLEDNRLYVGSDPSQNTYVECEFKQDNNPLYSDRSSRPESKSFDNNNVLYGSERMMRTDNTLYASANCVAPRKIEAYNIYEPLEMKTLSTSQNPKGQDNSALQQE